MYKLLISACAVALACGAANATNYVGSASFGGTSVGLNFTTDGATGVLSQADVTAWSITLNNGGSDVVMNEGNSGFTYLSGTAFSATATQLLFDFDGYGHMQFDNFSSTGNGAFCLTAASTPGFTCIGVLSDETVVANGGLTHIGRSGLFVLGTTSSAPEPASWAMMVGGFGAIGGAMRSRRTAIAARA